jgi:peptide/nickel transport system substrate-binding protein
MKPSKVLLTIFSLIMIVSMVTACGQPTPLPVPPTAPPEMPAATEAPPAPAATEMPVATEMPAATEAPAMAGKPPAITVDDMQGIALGKYPTQYELAEFEAATGGKMEFSGRTTFDPKLTAIFKDIPADVTARLPEEPLVVVPYDEIGKYGGQLEGLSLGPESGNSEYLSWRHANFVRYAEDLETIVPNVVKDYQVSDDLKTFTFTLRKGHKWSDGQPFTTADVQFWWDDIIMNKDLTPEVPTYWTFGGEPMKVEIVDDVTFKFVTAAPAPGMMPWLARTWILPAAPRHWLESKHIKYNPNINDEAVAAGKESWVDYFYTFHGEWMDSVHRWTEGLPRLEAWVVVEETPEYQLAMANPYYFKVDTAGQQLPYADNSRESYSQDAQVLQLKVINGEVDQKAQTLAFKDAPVYKEHEVDGNYKVTLSPSGSDGMNVAFNCTSKDPVLRPLFSNPDFSYAMSIALDRAEFNKVTCFGECEEINTGVPIHPSASFAKPEWYKKATEYDPAKANQMLDALGLDKKDSEGFRLRSDGKRLVIFANYTIQSMSSEAMALIKSYWEAVGVKVELKEVATEAYRSLVANNDHDLASFTSGGTLEPSFLANQYRFYPPFGDPVLEPQCGLPYLEWYKTNGAKGEEPPEDMKRLYELTEQFKVALPGTPEYIKIGQEIGDIHSKNMYMIGIIGPAPSVQIGSNRLGNYIPAKISAFEFYREYPYRPDQWFIKQ